MICPLHLTSQAHPTRVRITHKLTYDAADEIIAKATGSATESIQGEEGSSSEDSSDDRASSGDDASHSSEAIHSSSENRAMDSSSSSASSNSVASTSGAADAGVEMDMRVMSLALKARCVFVCLCGQDKWGGNTAFTCCSK